MNVRVVKRNGKFIPQFRAKSKHNLWEDFLKGVWDGSASIQQFELKEEADKFLIDKLINMNAIFQLEPTRNKYGVWSFDDPNTGLVGEPFVGETNTLIDNMVREAGYKLESAANGIALLFSPNPFPGYQSEIVLTETSPFGSTYRNDKWDIMPWLCPALFKYFPTAPARLYSMVKH
jgi:hypothetical protein